MAKSPYSFNLYWGTHQKFVLVASIQLYYVHEKHLRLFIVVVIIVHLISCDSTQYITKIYNGLACGLLLYIES